MPHNILLDFCLATWQKTENRLYSWRFGKSLSSIQSNLVLTTLCNMCLIEAPDGRVLVQHRLPKPDNAWAGLTFPGGHVEPGESVTAAPIREVHEETGLMVTGLQSCGFVEWWNPERQSLYIVFLLRTRQFSGELHSSREGEMEWMPLDQMCAGKMAPNMEKYLRVFLEDQVPECFGISGKGLTVIGG